MPDQGQYTMGLNNFVNTLWQQALISYPALSLGMRLLNGSTQAGYMYLGPVNTSAIVGNTTNSITNWTVTVNTGEWALTLVNMCIMSSLPGQTYGLGYNGYMTIATNSQYSVLPDLIFVALLNLTGIVDAIETTTYGELSVASVLGCSFAFGNFEDNASFPNISFYFNNFTTRPFNVTPSQYLIRGPSDTCYFAFAGSLTVPPNGSAYTFGTYILNGTYTLFDYMNEIFGVAPLV